MVHGQGRCPHWNEYSRDQLPHLQSCIDENKWYLSEAAGRDVGYPFAEAHFVDNHLDRVAAEFRHCYCTERCRGRHLCSGSTSAHALNRAWAEKEKERRAAQPVRDITVCLPAGADSQAPTTTSDSASAPPVPEKAPDFVTAQP